ncbi:MAG: glycosyltransferase [Lachnospiraceae bacterium]|nr:glycosyltransferase [Lachnospiraceae bacterium]
MTGACIKDKKHIAFYIGSLNKGGAERVMCNLAEFFFNEGYKVTLVTTYLADDEYDVQDGKWTVIKKGADAPCELPRGYKELTVLNPDDELKKVYLGPSEKESINRVFTALMPDERGGRIVNLQRRIRKLRNTWIDIKPDIIISFLGKNNVMALRSSKGLGIPVVVSVRSNPAREYADRLLNMSMKSLFQKAAGIAVQTNGAADFFKGALKDKCKVLPNSLHPGFMDRAIVPFDEREKEIISVGRLDENKNQILLIRAFADVVKIHPEYKLRLFGDGPSKGDFEKEAKNLGLNDSNVIFEGNVSDVASKISRASIFVLPSKQEGMPNALLEAMSLGIACISTDCPCGGPADIINDGQNGLLIPMGNDDDMKDSLVKALLRLIEDKALPSSISNKALDIRKTYAPERINGLWKDYVDQILKSR